MTAPSRPCLLAALLCAASASAMSQTENAPDGEREVPPDATRHNYPLPAVPGADKSAEALSAAVARELRHDPLIDPSTIDVSASNHVVTLTGSQPLLIARDRATYVAETVRGVSQVINQIEVNAGREVEGERLESDILYALLTDPATERQEFTVQASDTGDVVLGGEVESGAERAIAENIVKSIAGVRSVINNVALVRAQARSDEQILADVTRMLQWDAYVGSGDIQVAVKDGVVTLDGVVATPAEKRRAVGLSWVAGVKHVNVVPLEVDSSQARASLRAPKTGTPLEMRSDDAIAETVRQALSTDPRIAASNIDVSVKNRVVTLAGTVNNLRAKRVAARIPYGILGVSSVRDQLHLPEASGFDDDEILFRVQRSLSNNSIVRDDPISVTVRQGAVTLQGAADSKYSRALAEDLAGGVRGVTRVENGIRVDKDAERFSYDPYVDVGGGIGLPFDDWPTEQAARNRPQGTHENGGDSPIEENVRSELWWSPFVDDSDITIDVENAVVTLKGTVGSEAERRAAIENAFEGGAISVKNQLVVAE